MAQQETIQNITGEATITKSTVLVPSIPTGEPFNYKINFQNLNQANTLSMTDVLPLGLCYAASDIIADPSFIDFNGNVVNPNTIPGLIDTSNLPTVIFNIPNYIQRGSFTITVTFCAGITPDGFTVTNHICADYGNGTNNENFCTSTGITSTASAINPWGEITKEPLFPAIAGPNGDYYIPTSGGASNYKIRIQKSPPYEPSIFGMLNLTNVTISEMFLPCASVTLISGPGTFNPVTNTITLNNDLQGSVPYEFVEFIVNVDYSGCGNFNNNQVISNTVELNGTPVGENPIINIDSNTADVIAVDNLPPPNGSSSIAKTVEASNPVPGCLGRYTINYTNTDNRPISFSEIEDILPNNILPQNISITGMINSASITDTFDLIVNNGTPTVVSMATGFSGNPWATTNNSFTLRANINTLLYPNDIIRVTIEFIIDANNPTGSVIANCADFDGSIIDIPNNINLPVPSNSCVSFAIETPEVKLCATKGVRKANTSNPFSAFITNIVPTDELEFQICVQNNGSVNYNGDLVDVLDAKYEFISVVSNNLPSGSTFNQNGQTLTWGNIDLFQNCNAFAGIYGCLNPSNPSYCVIIKVRVKPLTPPGNIDNSATISGANANPETTELAKVNIIQASVLKLEQEVTKDLNNYGQTIPLNPVCDITVFYKITITNLGNIPVAQHQIINEFPHIGDVYYPTTLARNSSFSYKLIADYNSPDYIVSYLNSVPSTTTTPPNFDCNTVPPGNPFPSIYDITMVFDSQNSLAVGASNTIVVETTIDDPYALNSGDIAVNSAYFVDCGTSNGNIIVPTNMTQVTIESPLDTCTPLVLDPYANAVPDIMDVAVQQELSSGGLTTMDKEYGDVDNDRDIDIIYTKNNHELFVLENTAGPGVMPIYNTPGTSLNITNYAYSYRLIDWDNDGWQDLVVYDSDPGQTTYQISLYLNNGNGTFSATSSVTFLQGNVDFPIDPNILIELGDLNGDTLPDLLMSSQWGIYGTAYFENTGGSSPYFILPAPQSYTPGGASINNIFIPDDGGSYQTAEIFDADCDGDNDIFISDPLYDAPNWGGGKMFFHENNGIPTTGTLPDINATGITELFGFIEILNNDLRCDWVIMRFVDYLGNGCPIAISYNPCNDKFFYYNRICYTCDTTISVSDFEDESSEDEILVYPNPSNDFIKVESKKNNVLEAIEIYSITGALIKETKKTKEPIDVSALSNGMYFIKIYCEGKYISKKLIKN
ncbi:MAG: T9SS type A sorting domain-containing protein [Flavobacteriaceae bacterium]|nr:T9SS type A sorting domain-containing protein [Flavobacteriaceae bacterium]